MKLKSVAAVAATLLAFSASSAFAHTGAGSTAGFMAGLSHPLLGADHFLAMLAVGLWAGAIGGRATWLVPGSFIVAMILGGVLGAQGMALPAVELGITFSVIALGALLAFNPSLPLAVSMAIAAVFAIFHGHAHGTEMPADISGITYGLGFIAATAVLHATGLVAILSLKSRLTPAVLRITGGAVGLAGVALLAS
ncbi:MAG: HupE/UreJ family protein [Rhodospirillaceae bacterium]|nr:HupE/UreJ family protein [Rhodospirillaceae bacterium]